MKFIAAWTTSLGLLWLVPVWTLASSPEDEAAMAALAQVKLADLPQLEVTLDDAFDVFDGLVKRRRTAVASGIKQAVERTPAITSVITAQDIEAMGARTLEDVLQSVPGLQVSYVHFNNEERYTIRGILSDANSAVLVLLNGLRLNNARNGAKAPVWMSFPVTAIARLEIIRGPGSALYGAEAFAGVINIITKTAADIDGTEAGLRLGNHHTRDGWLLHGSRHHGFEVAAMFEFTRTDGHQRLVERDAQSVFDESFGTDASLAPGPYADNRTTYDVHLEIAKQHWRLRSGFHRGEDMGTGGGIAQALDPGDAVHEEALSADLSYDAPAFSDHWGVTANLSYLHTNRDFIYVLFPPGAFGGAYPHGYIGMGGLYEKHAHLALNGFYHGWANHLLRVGGGYDHYDYYKITDIRNFGPHPFLERDIAPDEWVDISDTAVIGSPEPVRNNRYVFVQDTWRISPQWELTTGVRYDHYSDFGGTTNPRLGLVWEPRADLVVRLLYGRAFRAPGFQELYTKNSPVIHGNPDLKPEKMATWEVAFDYHLSRQLHVALNLFRYEISEKVMLMPGSEAGSQFGFANAARWQGHGGEFELRWKISNQWSLLGNYSYQRSKDDRGTPLPNGPEHIVYLRGDRLLGANWYLDAQLNWNDGWHRAADDPRPALDGYTTVDMILRRKNLSAGHIDVALGVRNMFDADVRYPSFGPDAGSEVINLPNDLPGAGRFYFVEFRYQF